MNPTRPMTDEEVIDQLREIGNEKRESVKSKLFHTAAARLVQKNFQIVELGGGSAAPWWWASADYPDEGWSGPYPTREAALAEGMSHYEEEIHAGADVSDVVSVRQAHNSEMCSEIDTLTTKLEAQREALRAARAVGAFEVCNANYGDYIKLIQWKQHTDAIAFNEDPGFVIKDPTEMRALVSQVIGEKKPNA